MKSDEDGLKTKKEEKRKEEKRREEKRHISNLSFASKLMGLINKVDMVCLSPVGYGV